MNKKFIVTGLLVSMLITNTNIVTAFSSTNTVTKDSIENLKIYRKTSLSPSEDNKKFNIPFHTSEPLGIEVMEATEVDVLITGKGISGSANLALHDVNNLRGLKTVRVGEKTTVQIPRKGELFLEVENIKYDGNVEDDFSLDVTITLNGKDYKITPTYDIRKEKLTDKVLDEEKFEETIFSKENAEDGALLISDNVRIYVPKSKYIPKDIDASDTLDTHEKIIAIYNKVAGLDEKNHDEINRPRENFVLVSARNEQGGYMSAGGQMLDTLPQNIHEYFKKPKTQDVWGMYHEYGHMYEQGWGFIEYWNNMFANTLRRVDLENPNWSWIYGNEKTNYDIKSVIPSYENYLKTGKKGSLPSMYFFLSFIDNIDSEFMAKAETYYRENGYSRGEWDYIAYFIAKEYKLNVIPYIEAIGNSVTSQKVIDDVLENATSSFIYMSDTENFNQYKNISIPPTLKSIFDGKNSIISGMSNPNAEIFVNVDGTHYKTTADENGKFNYKLDVDISLDSNVSVASKEPGKETSFYKKLQIQDSTNEIMFKGYKSETFLTLKFDDENKKFKAASSGNPANVYMGGQYIKVEHYDKRGNKKGNYALNGGETADELANKLNETNYRDGDYLKLYHAEKDRLAINGKVKNAPAYINASLDKVDLDNSYFYIIDGKLTYSNIRLDLGFNKDDLEDFIEKVGTLKKDDYTKTTWNNVIEKSNEAKSVYDNNEASDKEIVESAINLKEAIENLRAVNLIEFIGSNSNMFLKLEFDMGNKKFKATSNGEIAHRYYGSAVYATIAHYDKKGNEKGKYQIRANETSEAVVARLNETRFVDGDYLKFTHLEKTGAFRIKGYIENSPSDLSNGVGNLDLNNSFFYLVGESLKYSASQLDLSANKDDLIVKVEESKKISDEGYTKSSFENLQNKISEGETLLETPNLYEEDVTDTISNIDTAIKNLRKINEVVFKGYNNEIILSLKFDTDKNKFVALSSGKTANPYLYSSEYIRIDHYNKKGQLNGSYKVLANQNADKIAEQLNQVTFKEDDYFKLNHAEKNGRLAIKGYVENTPWDLKDRVGDLDLNNSMFYLTGENLIYSNKILDLSANTENLKEAISKAKELKENQYTKTTWLNLQEKIQEGQTIADTVNVDTEEVTESINNIEKAIKNLKAVNIVEFIGSHSNMFLKLEFDMVNKKFKAISNGEIAHRYYGSAVYATITHYDKKGNEKGKYQIRANETSEAVAAKLNETSFLEGDYLKFTHLEKTGAFRIKGYIENTPSDLSNGVGNLDLSTSLFYLNGENLQYSNSQLDLSYDKTKLIEKIKVAKGIFGEGYTKSSFENLQNKISESETLVETPNLYEEDVTEAISNIDTSIKNLRKINEVVFKGYNNEIILSLKFDTDKNKFVAVSSGKTANPYLYSREYIRIDHYNKKGQLNGSYKVLADQNADKIAEQLNQITFKEDDYFKLNHAEKNGRLAIKGYVENTPWDLKDRVGDLDLNSSMFLLGGENLTYSVN